MYLSPSMEKNKNKRKVILLKFKDGKDTLILTQTVKKSESLKIELQCGNKTESVKDGNDVQDESLIFPAQLKDRTVPRCLRDKCRKHGPNHKSKSQNNKRKEEKNAVPLIIISDDEQDGSQCEISPGSLSSWSEDGIDVLMESTRKKSESKNNKRKKNAVPLIIISDDEQDGLQCEDISSGSLSSWSEDEIDVLMESTRKRMKYSDKEWIFNNVNSKRKESSSHSSLKEDECIKKRKIYAGTDHDVKPRLPYEADAKNSPKIDDIFEIYEYVHSTQPNIATNADNNNPRKKIKVDPQETNNNKENSKPDCCNKLEQYEE